MKKLALLAGVTVLATGMAMAGGADMVSPFDGIFVGASAGVATTNTRVSVIDSTGVRDLQANQTKTSFTGGFDLGWGKTFGAYYTALEGFYRHTSGQTDVFSATGLTVTALNNITMKNTWGGDVQFGYLATHNIMPYVLLGFSSVRLSGTAATDDDGQNISATKTKTGFTPGFGVRVAMTNNLVLRMQYTHAFYKMFNKADAAGSDNANIRADQSAATVGVDYTFNV